jgi:hypothetical protein
MRPVLVKLAQEAGEPLKIGHTWSLLSCPFSAHCDKRGPCKGFTPENRQRIAQIEDQFFAKGYHRIRG